QHTLQLHRAILCSTAHSSATQPFYFCSLHFIYSKPREDYLSNLSIRSCFYYIMSFMRKLAEEANDMNLKDSRRYLEDEQRELAQVPPKLPYDLNVFTANSPETDAFFNDCAQGRLEQIQQYIENNHPEPKVLQQGLTKAALENQVDVARYLFSKGTKLYSQVLAAACTNPAVAFFRLLVEEQGWHPNQAMHSSIPALVMCVKNEQVLRYLLDHGADPNQGTERIPANPRGVGIVRSGDAINSAAAGAEPYTIDLLLQRGAKMIWATPLHIAALAHSRQNDRRSMIEHLIKLGWNINGNDYMYNSQVAPLQTVVSRGNVDAAALLLELDANPDIVLDKPPWFREMVDRAKDKKAIQQS
ncbi:ankyrin repeat-containing domain protein, partial [Whalleya microplaca]